MKLVIELTREEAWIIAGILNWPTDQDPVKVAATETGITIPEAEVIRLKVRDRIFDMLK
jgi:hypothetical protein